MSNTTYYNPNSELCLEIRQWFLDNPQDNSDYESFNGWGGWNEKIHRNIDRSSIVMGENNSFYGKTHTPETRKKMSEIAKKRFSCKENHPFYNKKHSEEVRKKMSESQQKRRNRE